MSDAADLCYPPKADANGTAKKYYRRRAYYFGRHNTPESFILFGEWKRRLVETGEPPEVKTVRIDLEHSINERARGSKIRPYVWPAVTAVSSMLLAASITASVLIFSTVAVPMVDGQPLTTEEALIIRGVRRYEGTARAVSRNRAARLPEIYSRVLKLGPNDGPLHRTELKLPTKNLR